MNLPIPTVKTGAGLPSVRWSRRGRPDLRRGFTLLEILVAIAIFTAVLVAIYASWSSVLHGTLTDALMSAEMFNANARYYSFIADTSSDFAYLSMASCLSKSFVGSGLFGDLVVRRVTFSVEPGTNSDYQLVMYQQPLLVETNVNEQLGPLVLARDISLFTLEFWDIRTNGWTTEWLYTNQLPKMVRVSLGYGRQNRFFNRPAEIQSQVVLLSGMSVPREYQILRAGPGGPGVPAVPGGPGGVGGQGADPARGQGTDVRQPGRGGTGVLPPNRGGP
jgi:prepilin-type N-terminal cleavage/methylation domain-containing protein